MRISEDTIKGLMEIIRAKVGGKETDFEEEKLRIYTFAELVLYCAEDGAFDGLTFFALNRRFYVMDSQEVLLGGVNEDGEDDGLLVTDDNLVKALNAHLRWRTRVAKEFGV